MSSMPNREVGRTAVTVASLPWRWWNSSSLPDIDVGHAVAIGEHEVSSSM